MEGDGSGGGARGAVGVVLLHVVCAVLYRWMPCEETSGYVCDRDGKPLKYRLSGLRVYAVVVTLFITGAWLGLYPATVFVDDFWSVAMTANVLGLAGSLLAFIHGKRVPPAERLADKRRALTIDQARRTQQQSKRQQQKQQKQEQQEQQEQGKAKQGLGALLEEFYAGLEFNPRLFGLDLKMYSYLYGAVLLQLVLVSAVAAHFQAHDNHICLAMATYVGLFSWFLAEYIYFENVHLYTYDLFAERFGFKLLWGCWVFYPLFYPIGVWPLIQGGNSSTEDISPAQTASIILLFYCGWVLTRGANLQKYHFKVHPGKPFLGLIKPETISDTRILYSGFWGMARHINYFGEILQGVALALPGFLLTGSFLPWLYPLYYMLLLIPRQWEDDRVCEEKYGVAWIEYTTRVPYRVVPFLY